MLFLVVFAIGCGLIKFGNKIQHGTNFYRIWICCGLIKFGREIQRKSACELVSESEGNEIAQKEIVVFWGLLLGKYFPKSNSI